MPATRRCNSPRRKAAAALALCLPFLAACHFPPRQPVYPQQSEVPPPPANSAQLAEVAHETQNYAAAVPLYRKLIDQGADTVENRLGLADSLLGTGDLDSAAAQYRRAETMAPQDPRPGLGLGRLYLVQHRPASALSAYSLVLQLDSHNLIAFNGKGVALDLMDQHDLAQHVYRRGLAIDPDDRTLRNNLGLSLVFSKNYTEAVTILTALAQDPRATPRNRQNLALALGLEGDKANAQMVAAHDLDNDDVQSNLRYYDYIRDGGGTVPAHTLVPPAQP